MKGSRYDILANGTKSYVWVSGETNVNLTGAANHSHTKKIHFAPLRPLRQWIDQLEIQSPDMARLICQVIPSRCPFERTLKVFGRTILRIPPLCKLNPLYEELVGLRFRALCYLADVCGEDVSNC